MPKEFPRNRRVAEQIQRVLAEAVARGVVRDADLSLATFTEAEVSRDLAYAKVYVSKIGSDDPAEIVAALNAHAYILRKEIARQIRLRIVPELKFLPDTSTAQGDYMDRLIAEARSSDPQDNPYVDPDQTEGSDNGA